MSAGSVAVGHVGSFVLIMAVAISLSASAARMNGTDLPWGVAAMCALGAACAYAALRTANRAGRAVWLLSFLAVCGFIFQSMVARGAMNASHPMRGLQLMLAGMAVLLFLTYHPQGFFTRVFRGWRSIRWLKNLVIAFCWASLALVAGGWGMRNAGFPGTFWVQMLLVLAVSLLTDEFQQPGHPGGTRLSPGVRIAFASLLCAEVMLIFLYGIPGSVLIVMAGALFAARQPLRPRAEQWMEVSLCAQSWLVYALA